jgi:folate-binding protein YgfZ
MEDAFRTASPAAPPGYRELHAAVAWVDAGSRTCLAARGPDAVKFIDAFTTASVSRLADGAGSEGFFTDARGWVLALANVLRDREGVWIDAAPGLAPMLRDHLEHHHIRERVEIEDESARWWHVIVAGPRAGEWLTPRLPVAPPRGHLDHVETRLGPVAVTVVRVDGQGPPGFLLRHDSADRRRLADWLRGEGLPLADPRSWSTARIEWGYPSPADIPERTLPQELGRDERAICLTKGCYLGQETVARIDALGHVNRRLVALALAAPAEAGAAVTQGGETVGRLTSVCHSPAVGTWLGLGLVLVRAAAGDETLAASGAAARRVPLPVEGREAAVPEAAAGGATDDRAGEQPGELLLRARRFDVVRVGEPLPGGGRREREVVLHPGSVVVVPLVSADTVCLVEVVRVAVGRTLLELPAGTLDREESLAAAAGRELTEETGYRAGRIEAAGAFWMSPGILRERMHLFIARDLEPGPQALEPGEQISVRVVTWSEAVAMCLDGRIEDAKTVAGILLTDARRRASGR